MAVGICIVAGIVPLMIHPQTREKYFLLGEDARGGVWSDFGGARNSTEFSPEDIAGRECFEESAALLPNMALQLHRREFIYGCHMHVTPSRHRHYANDAHRRYTTLQRRVVRPAQPPRAITCSRQDTGHVNEAMYRTYFFVEIPWNPNICEKFQYVRGQLDVLVRYCRAVRYHGKQLRQILHGNDLPVDLLPMIDMTYSIPNNKHVHVTDLGIYDDAKLWIQGRGLIYHQVRAATIAWPVVNREIRDVYMQYVYHWQVLRDHVVPDCIRNHVGVRKPPNMCIPYVRKDFVEKRQIKLWSMSELVSTALSRPASFRGPILHAFEHFFNNIVHSDDGPLVDTAAVLL